MGCTQKREGISSPCSGVRVKYEDLIELVKQDLNSFIKMSDEEIKLIADELVKTNLSENAVFGRKEKIDKIKSRLSIIDKMISKLYLDNAEGKISDKRLKITVDGLENEYDTLTQNLSGLVEREKRRGVFENDVLKFFNLVKQYTRIEELTRDILLTFVDRIEVGEKVFPDGVVRNTHLNQPFTQEIKIYHKFIKKYARCSEKNFRLRKTRD